MTTEDLTHTTPPYRVGDLYMPAGLCGDESIGMVVSVKDEQHGRIVRFDLMDYYFTESDLVSTVFEEYDLSYNEHGEKLSLAQINIIKKNNYDDPSMKHFHRYTIPTIEELESFFNNIKGYYALRQRYYPSYDFVIENNSKCECFVSCTLNDDATKVYVYDVKKMTTYPMPIDGYHHVNKILVKSFYDDGHKREVRNRYEDKSGCYIATAVYGSYDCPEVWTLRRYRDNVLDNTWYGRTFIHTYYAISPTLVRWFGKTNWFRNMFFKPLSRWVAILNKRGFEDTPYNDKY